MRKPTYERSLASHEKSEFFSKKNGVDPRDLFMGSQKKYLFDCPTCDHEFTIALAGVKRGNWCQYCARHKLCGDVNCELCKERSFASHEKALYFSKRNGVEAREVFKQSNLNYWFNCDKCPHEFNMVLSNVIKGKWCHFCSGHKICKSDDCDFCFKKSFASSDKATYWIEEKNGKKARDVFLCAIKKYWFKCGDCPHEFQASPNNISKNRWCSYCGGRKLCKEENCDICYEKSFASHKRVEFWIYEKNKKIPREVFKKTSVKYWFRCSCKHEFKSILSNVVPLNRWCAYCAHKKLCSDEDCKSCYENSFASHEKVLYWSKKNNKPARMVFRGSNKLYLFNCLPCKEEFSIRICKITCENGWCQRCNQSKLERLASEKLKILKIMFESQKTFNVLRNKRCLPFDLYLEEYNALIELDGIQHFEHIRHFHKDKRDFKARIKTDIKKNNYAIKNNYNLLRISYLEIKSIKKYLKLFAKKIKSSEEQVIMFSNKELYDKTYLL